MVAIGRAQASSREAGHEWTTDERDAAAGLLISRNRIHAVQGLAGSAKTSTCTGEFCRGSVSAGQGGHGDGTDGQRHRDAWRGARC